MISMQTYNLNYQLGQKQKNNNQVNNNKIAFGINAANIQSKEDVEAAEFRKRLSEEFDDQLELVRNLIGQGDDSNKKPANSNSSDEFKTDARNVILNPVKRTIVEVKQDNGESCSRASLIENKVRSAFSQYKGISLNPLQENRTLSQADTRWIEYRDEEHAKLKPYDEEDYAILENNLKNEGFSFKPNHLKKLYQVFATKVDKEIKANPSKFNQIVTARPGSVEFDLLKAFDPKKKMDLNRLVNQEIITEVDVDWIKHSTYKPKSISKQLEQFENSLSQANYSYDEKQLIRLHKVLTDKQNKKDIVESEAMLYARALVGA
ncbi:MAG: hypothetical protein WCK67_07695 [bacterium]